MVEWGSPKLLVKFINHCFYSYFFYFLLVNSLFESKSMVWVGPHVSLLYLPKLYEASLMTSHQQPSDPLSIWQAHQLIWICHRAPRTAARAQATATFQICWQAHATHRHRFLSLKAGFILVLPRQNPIWSRRAASLAGWSNKCTDDQLIHLLLVKHNARINLSTCTARFFNDREGKTDGAQKGSSHRQPPIWNSGPVLIGRILTIITVALIMFCLTQSRTSTIATLWFPNTWWTQAAAAAELDPAGHRADPATLTARSHHYHDDLDLFHFSFWFIFLHTNTRLLLNLRQLRYGAGGFSYKSTWTLQELFPLIIMVVNFCQLHTHTQKI